MAAGKRAGKISDRTVERLNTLMRPAKGAQASAVLLGLLQEIAESEDAIAALAHVFADWPWARFSGPPTPASAYPEPFDDRDGSRDVMEYQAYRERSVEQNDRRLRAIVAAIEADGADVTERARRAWDFLSSIESRTGRVAAFDVILSQGSLFVQLETLPTEVPYNALIPNDEWGAIMWRNRRVHSRLLGTVSQGSTIRTKAARGAVILRALAEIGDERERAAVFGDFLHRLGGMLQVQGATAGAGMVGLSALHVLMEGLAGEGPCPGCGKVHGEKEPHAKA